MTPRSVTIWFMISWIAIAIIYDIAIAAYCGNADCTISRIMHDWSMGNPIVAFALGVLCGHFFWAQASACIHQLP